MTVVKGHEWQSHHAPRYLGWFLLSHALNAVFYMLTFGSSVFVLFLDDLGLSKDRIGLMLALFPFCGMVAPAISRAVTRFGFKRTYVLFYGVRKFVILLLLAAPWVLGHFGPQGLFLYVAVVISVFALCRAIAETGYYPWVREFIPDAIRGRVSGQVNVVVSLASAMTMLLASFILAHGVGYGRYQLLIGIASALGVVSVLAITAVPRESLQDTSAEASRLSLQTALRDKRFRGFLAGVALSILGMAGYPFLPLMARDRLLVPEAQVVLFDVAATVGALVSSIYWGWASDRYGGKPLTLVTSVVVGILPWLWLPLPSGRPAAFVGGLVLAFVYGVVNTGLGIGSVRWLLNDIVPMDRRTAYTSVWYAGAGLAGGAAPFLAGWMLRGLVDLSWHVGPVEVHTFAVLFFSTSVLTLLSIVLYARVPAEADSSVWAYLRATLLHDVMGTLQRVPNSLRSRDRASGRYR